VLCATDLDEAVEERLAKLSGEVRHAGVTVVMAGAVPEEAQRRIVVDGDRVRVEPLGVSARREQWLAEDQLHAVMELLEVAGDTDDVSAPLFEGEPEHERREPGELGTTGSDELDAKPTDGAGEAVEGLVDDSTGQGRGPAPEAPPRNGFADWTPLRSESRPWLDPDEEGEPEVEVRVLGPIEVAGRDRLAVDESQGARDDRLPGHAPTWRVERQGALGTVAQR
jgi:hypothetical protein